MPSLYGVTYNEDGTVAAITPMDGAPATVTKRVVEQYDFSRFKNLWLRLQVDVGASSYFSEIAMTQTLDNLRLNGVLDVIQYLERLPDHLIPRKDELIEELKKNRDAMEKLPQAPKAPGKRTGKPAGLVQQPGQLQAIGRGLPNAAKKAMIPTGRL